MSVIEIVPHVIRLGFDYRVVLLAVSDEYVNVYAAVIITIVITNIRFMNADQACRLVRRNWLLPLLLSS